MAKKLKKTKMKRSIKKNAHGAVKRKVISLAAARKRREQKKRSDKKRLKRGLPELMPSIGTIENTTKPSDITPPPAPIEVASQVSDSNADDGDACQTAPNGVEAAPTTGEAPTAH